ncbi:hypothetical protein D0X99_07080 [Algoriphagus lacus]|uniref:DUF2306 domain-containing protein n=1 Tax=Algoriphagus lacus TaxID=2056311 RepID=A0A418PVF1_9BACT|nr:hypothetical protein [Algoriphagus lacus]RIW17479.1 hypothetical protein D0X99_07080 [Algoriphagus lacus]
MISIPARNSYRLTALFIILILIGIQWGFYTSYTSQFPTFPNATTVIHIHGALLMIWLTLLVVQPMLINFKKAKLHRSIGKVSYVLGPMIIISMFLVGRGSYHRFVELAPEKDLLATMVLDIRGLVNFAIFWALAMAYRKTPSAHMRYMIATGILAIGPGVGRGLMASFDFSLYAALTATDVIDLVIVGVLLGYDLVKKNDFKPYLVVFSVLLVGKVLWQISYSDLWQNFARTYVELFY